MDRRVWIGEIVISPECALKLSQKHGVTTWEVREACLFGAHREARWHEHPVFGRRLLVRGETYAGRGIFAILRPIDENDGVWECSTARSLP